MNRIMIIGLAGAGKSTLARRLGVATDLPVHHLDQVFWKPAWTRRPADETRSMVADIEAQAQWIIEGGIAQSYPNRLRRADVVLWLDLPIHVRLWRLVRRTLQYRNHSRPDLPAGCTEPLSWARVTFLCAVWRERAEVRGEIAAAVQADTSGTAVQHLTTPAQIGAAFEMLAAQKP